MQRLLRRFGSGRPTGLPVRGHRKQIIAFATVTRWPKADLQYSRFCNSTAGRESRLTPHDAILEKAQSSRTDVAGLAQRVSPATVICRDEPMAKHTTLRVGGLADVFVEPVSEQDLAAVLAGCQERGLRFLVLGRGSNLLVKDGGFRGVV